MIVDWKSGRTGSLTAVISDLVDEEGDPLVWNKVGNVDELTFPSVLVNTNSDDELRFFERSIDVRVTFTNRGITPETATGSGLLDGKFGGRIVDGPLGVVGLWELEHGSIDHSDGEAGSGSVQGERKARSPSFVADGRGRRTLGATPAYESSSRARGSVLKRVRQAPRFSRAWHWLGLLAALERPWLRA